MSKSREDKPLQRIINGYTKEMKQLADEQASIMKIFRAMEDEEKMANLREDLYNDS